MLTDEELRELVEDTHLTATPNKLAAHVEGSEVREMARELLELRANAEKGAAEERAAVVGFLKSSCCMLCAGFESLDDIVKSIEGLFHLPRDKR